MAAIMDAFFFFNFSSNETIKPAWQVRGFSTPRKTSLSGCCRLAYKVKTETFNFVYILLFIFVSSSQPHTAAAAANKHTHIRVTCRPAAELTSKHNDGELAFLCANWLRTSPRLLLN